MTADEIEAEIVSAVDAIRRREPIGLRVNDATKERAGCQTVAMFSEYAGDYAGIEQTFDEAVRRTTKLWGPPSKTGFGRSSIHADVAGVPEELLQSRALRYAFWSNRDVLATLAMLTHDADTLRSFELCMRVPGP